MDCSVVGEAMSYVLHLWSQPAGRPLPAGVEEADRLLSELREAGGKQIQTFLVLAMRLTRRYPCICSPTGEALPESEWAWSDGPLNGRTAGAVYSIGLNIGRLDEVRPFVLEQARALNLQVMDEQAGEVYLADGRTLRVPAPVAESPQKNYDDVPTQREMDRIVLERLTPFLAQYGFKACKSDLSFKQTFSGGWHVIEISSIDMWPTYATFNLHVRSRFHAVTDLVAAVATPERPPEQVKHDWTTFVNQLRWMDDIDPAIQDSSKSYVVRSYSDIDVVIEHIFRKLQSCLLDVLEQYKTLQGLDQLLNTMPLTDSLFFTSFDNGASQVITAYLARNPNLAQICKEFEANSVEGKGMVHLVARTRRCIDFVRATPAEIADAG